MANDHVIEVEGRFIDNISPGADDAAESIKGIGDEAKKAGKETDKLGKKKAKPAVDADTNKFLRKIRQAEEKANKFGNKKTAKVLHAIDRASAVIDKVVRNARKVAGKTWQGIVKAKDVASSILKKVSSLGKGIAGKTWSAIVKVKDMATTPLSKIKNALFSIKSLIGAIAAGWAANQLLLKPINVADAYSSAKISFSTLLGADRGQQMMDDLDQFAKATPFNTTNVIENAQKMLAMGWDANDILGDMEIIGNAAAATGKLDQGLESIVRAMSQIKTKGKLSTEELNQLAEAGIAAKAMLAEGLGYGTGDSGIAKMTEELESGKIASDRAIAALLEGMKKYDGMMDSMANETVEGLWSQMKDAFDINIVRKWGQGLQDGAKRGFGVVLDLLDSSEDSLSRLGDTVYEVGKDLSNWAADKLEGAVEKITHITESDPFKMSSTGGKIRMLWRALIGHPLAEWWEDTVVPWWDNTAMPWIEEKAKEIGKGLGSGLTGGVLALLGIDTDDAVSDGVSIGSAFIDGFLEGFDTSKIGEAIMTWARENPGSAAFMGILMGGRALSGIGGIYGNIKGLFGGGKSTGSSFGDSVGTMTVNAAVVNVNGGLGGGSKSTVPTTGKSGSKSWLGSLIGSTGTATVAGSGILGKLASTGYALTGGAAGSALTGGTAAVVGGGSILGAVLGLLGIGDGIFDFVDASKEEKGSKARKDKLFQGGTKLGLVASGAGGGAAIGAAIGSLFGGVGAAPGALIGAGIGGLGAIFGGDKLGKSLSDATEEGGWIYNLTQTLGTFFSETLPRSWGNFWDWLGNFFTETIPQWASGIWNDHIVPFFTETIPEKWDEFWDGVGKFFTETIPFAIGYVAGVVYKFFSETLPEKWNEFWDDVGNFFTETIPQWADSIWNDHIVPFFTETLPEKWNAFWSAIGEFFTETIPQWADSVWNEHIVPFFTETLPEKWDAFWTFIGEFFTETLPQWASTIWNEHIVPFFTESVPQFFSDLWDSITGFFTDTLPSFAESVWSPISTFFSETIPGWIGSVWERVSGFFSGIGENFMSGFGSGSGGGKGGKARGGIVGGSSSMEAFARGGRPSFPDGGIVGGTTKFIRVNEEAPEMIIPLSSQRRDRAMKLWAKTGQLLGVDRFAIGGRSDRNSDNFAVSEYGSGDATSDRSVVVEVGGITVEIHVDANGSVDVVETIKAKAREVAEAIAGEFVEAFEGQFENTPARA